MHHSQVTSETHIKKKVTMNYGQTILINSLFNHVRLRSWDLEGYLSIYLLFFLPKEYLSLI